jgi:hypothetical protein
MKQQGARRKKVNNYKTQRKTGALSAPVFFISCGHTSGSSMKSDTSTQKDIFLAIVYFLLSTVITWWFIVHGSNLYHFDESKMILSCTIAGGKWGLQILGAILFMGEKRWQFIRRIAFTCLGGSIILLPFCFDVLGFLPGSVGFLYSLIAAVAFMLGLYYDSVRKTGVSIKWHLFWLACLATAITLQLTVVFHII